MANQMTNLTVLSATVHPAGNGVEQITITMRGSLISAIEPAGNAASKMRPKLDGTSQYTMTGVVGNVIVLTTDDVADTYVSLVG